MATTRLTLSEMAERLNTSVKTFRRDVKEKSIPYYPVGKRMRFDPVLVEEYLKSTEEEVRSNVVYLPVPKKRRKVITSQKFAEAR
jgi:excisionase family DNA binding protein